MMRQNSEAFFQKSAGVIHTPPSSYNKDDACLIAGKLLLIFWKIPFLKHSGPFPFCTGAEWQSFQVL